MSHDAVADGDDGDGEQLGGVVVVTRWGGGKLGAPPKLPLHLRPWEVGRRRCACGSGTPGVWRGGGCGGSSRPGARAATGVAQVLG